MSLRPVIRINLVGRQRGVLDSLASLIAGEPDLRVLSAPGCDDMSEKPDVVLFDLDEADDDAVFDHLRELAGTARTIAVSMSTGAGVALRVFQAGAVGLVSKLRPPEQLLLAIRKVHLGEAWLGRAMAGRVLDLARADAGRKGMARNPGARH